MPASGSSSDSGSPEVPAGNLYNAAKYGNFERFKSYAQGLDHLLIGKNKNSILHFHLNSPCKRSKLFAEKVLGQCPHLLWKINNDGDIPLHIAATYGHLEMVKLLIEEAKKPIHRDMEIGEEEAVRRMLRLKNKQHETALHLATRGNHLSVVKEILEHEDPDYTYTANKGGESPLYLAVNKKLGFNDIAIKILNKFESPDCSGPNGTTVLHAVVVSESNLAASYMNFTSTCLEFIPRNTVLVQTLHEWGMLRSQEVSPSSSSEWSRLLLRKSGIFVNQADESGWTPLHWAAYIGNSFAVRIILEKDNSSAYATDKERNRTALHMASFRGRVKVMKEIIKKCPECCGITDVRGWNMLHYAVIRRCDEAVKTIIKDSSLVYLINVRDIKGYTPLRLLMSSRHNSSLLSWLQSDKSTVPSQYFDDEIMSIFLSFRNRHMFLIDEDRDKKEIQEWMKDLGKDPFGRNIVGMQHCEERENEFEEKVIPELFFEFEEKVIPELEKAKESHLVAAALVATVTFAAAFTLPGGYITDDDGDDSKLKGTPILSRNTAFKAFVITDAIAMALSTSSVFIQFIMVLLGYKQRYYWLVRSAFWFIVLAMGAMVVAFVTGIYAVLEPSMEHPITIATVVIGLTFFVHVFYASIRLIYEFIKRDRAEDRSSTITKSLGRLLDSTPRYLSCWRNWHKLRYGYNWASG